jgi:hypothetical protein
MKFGIHNPSWVFGADPAKAFEAVRAKAQMGRKSRFRVVLGGLLARRRTRRERWWLAVIMVHRGGCLCRETVWCDFALCKCLVEHSFVFDQFRAERFGSCAHPIEYRLNLLGARQ